jgi:hypothetical protein
MGGFDGMGKAGGGTARNVEACSGASDDEDSSVWYYVLRA